MPEASPPTPRPREWQPLSEIAPKIQGYYDYFKAGIEAWEPSPCPPLHVIDDYALPSAPYLDELEDRQWLR